MKGYSNVVEAVVLSTLSGNCGESAHNADVLSPGCGLGQIQRELARKGEPCDEE